MWKNKVFFLAFLLNQWKQSRKQGCVHTPETNICVSGQFLKIQKENLCVLYLSAFTYLKLRKRQSITYIKTTFLKVALK